MVSRVLIFAIAWLLHLNGLSQELALTFDDSPTGDSPLFSGNERSQAIIRHLREKQVEQAAFFVLTGNIHEGTRDRLIAYTKAGHLLANHSHSHRWIHETGAQHYIRDLATADSILQQFSGYQPWYRYPYLDEGRTAGARDSVRRALSHMGLINGYVTIDNYDWYLNSLLLTAVSKGKEPDFPKLRDIYLEHIWQSVLFYDGIARKHLSRSPKHVLLLHENDLAALFLGDLIDYLKKKGCKIITPAEAYRDPISGHLPDVLFNGQGRVAAIAREKGVLPRELVQESEDEAYLDALVMSRKAFH